MPDLVTESSSAIRPVEAYQIIRSQIEHEDNLNSQRLSWFVASQAFLFTAYAIVITNLNSRALPRVDRQEHLLVMLIPAMALLVCALIYATILAGTLAMTNLRKHYQSKMHTVVDLLPPVQGYRLTQFFGQAGPLGLPPVFIAVWLVVLAGRMSP